MISGTDIKVTLNVRNVETIICVSFLFILQIKKIFTAILSRNNGIFLFSTDRMWGNYAS